MLEETGTLKIIYGKGEGVRGGGIKSQSDGGVGGMMMSGFRKSIHDRVSVGGGA